MKTPELDITQDVELTIQPDFQTAPFVIVGDAEAVLPIAEDAQAYDKAHPVKAQRVGHSAVRHTEALQTAVSAKVGSLATRLKTDATAALYDARYKTNMLGLVRERRQQERDLNMARKLGLVSTVYCQKHERELAKVRGL